MFHLGDELVGLRFPLDVNMIDLEGCEEHAHSLVVSADVVAQNHREEPVDVFDNEGPHLCGHVQGLLGFRYLEASLTHHD